MVNAYAKQRVADLAERRRKEKAEQDEIAAYYASVGNREAAVRQQAEDILRRRGFPAARKVCFLWPAHRLRHSLSCIRLRRSQVRTVFSLTPEASESSA